MDYTTDTFVILCIIGYVMFVPIKFYFILDGQIVEFA